jgi:glycine hydroxymethyltransferase
MMESKMKMLKNSDPVLFDICKSEFERQKSSIELIASESFVPLEIMELQGSILTNKTTEGYPGKRYHAGCKVIDEMESLAIMRAKTLFGAEHANIQPHCGSSANQAVYLSVMKPNDTILGMSLDQGGHLTHGHKLNFSGKTYNFYEYGCSRETETIDYEQLEATAKEVQPKMIVAGASAYPRFIDYERISKIANSVDAYFFVDMAHVAGLVAAGVHPSPVPYADFVTSTTTKTLAGARGGFILCKEKYAKDIDRAVFPGVQGSPHLQIMAAKAFTFGRAMTEEFKTYAKNVVTNSKALGEALKERGFRLVSGGTDNHLLLVDLRSVGLTGIKFEKSLEKAGITVNKNMIPFDPEKPMVSSGVRIGVAAVTIKGMGPAEMVELATLIDMVAKDHEDESVIQAVSEKASELSKRFPMYSGYIE